MRALRGSRDGVLLVALLDGRVVGRLDAARDLHPAAAHVAEFGIVVARDVRREGVGSALLAGLRRWCGQVTRRPSGRRSRRSARLTRGGPVR